MVHERLFLGTDLEETGILGLNGNHFKSFLLCSLLLLICCMCHWPRQLFCVSTLEVKLLKLFLQHYLSMSKEHKVE